MSRRGAGIPRSRKILPRCRCPPHRCARPPPARPAHRSGRQIDRAPLCAARSARRRVDDAHPFRSRGRLPVRRWPACATWRRRGRRLERHRYPYWDEVSANSVRRQRPSTPATRARRCGSWRRAGRPAVLRHDDRRRPPVPPPDAPRDRAAGAHGRPFRGDRRPSAVDGVRHAPARHCTPARDAQRAGKELPCCSPASTPKAPQRRRAGRDPRSHRARAGGLRRARRRRWA